MKNIAIVGLGNHVRKNIIPTFEQLDWRIKYFVVRDRHKYKSGDFQGTIVDDISSILADRSIDYFYIATPISTHYQFSKIALTHGHNVICEKPITVKREELRELEAIAEKNGCSLHQVVMYKHHRQYLRLKELLLSGTYGAPKHVFLSFKIPHLPKSDIRYDRLKGGGALLDVGFYPLSAALDLFPDAELFNSVMTSEPGYDVDLAGAALLVDSKNTIITCQWSIGACYENKLVLDFSGHRVIAERIFSKPSSFETALSVYNTMGGKEQIETGRDDQFLNMFSQLSLAKGLDPAEQKTVSVMERIFDYWYASENL